MVRVSRVAPCPYKTFPRQGEVPSEKLDEMQPRIAQQIPDAAYVSPQEMFDGLRCGIPATQPDDFRGRTMKPASFSVVRILRDDEITSVLRVLPDHFVRRPLQTKQAHVHGIRIDISQLPWQLVAEILIEEQLHAAGLARLCSRSAA